MNNNSINFNFFFKYHLFFLVIFTGYVVSYFFFNDFTLFYIDRFDNEIVYNHILGNFYKGELDAAKVMLNGETKIYWLRRFFQPYSFIYIFDTKIAYWSFDILTKIISYFSFYILAKKYSQDYKIVSLSSCFFASLNIYSVWGVLISIFPYFVYLLLFKKNLKLKHYLIAIVVGLNSELVHSPFFSIYLLIFLIAFNSFNKRSLKNLISISIFFYSFVLLSNSNIIYAFLFDGPFHREEIETIFNKFSIKDVIINLFYLDIFFKDKIFSYEFAKEISYFFYTIIFFPLIFFSKSKELFLVIIYCLLIWFLSLILTNTNFYIKKYWNPNYYFIYTIFIYSFIFLIVIKKFKKIIPISLIIVILFQVSPNFVPFAKKYVEPFKVKNFRNYYTFNDYYLKNTYTKIKDIVGDKKIISLWPADPMVAVMNNINSLDGEHNLYPLSYKKKFYEIIKEELEANKDFKDYYLKWGHRVYAFVSDPLDIKIDFMEAKKQGAEFVISKYLINDEKVKKILEIYELEKLYLYKIN